MKTQTQMVKRVAIVMAICFASAFMLAACTNTGEHPHKEHPEHPKTNAPPANP